MSKYLTDIALYGAGLFLFGVGWEMFTALMRKYREPRLPFKGSSYDSSEPAHYEVARR